MTRAALITTTINVPTNLQDWAACLTEDDVIVIAGDQKSPHDGITELCNRVSKATGITTLYVHPEAQRRWLSSDAIGWNCIQRRNIAVLEALQFKPEFIITVDDDNFPVTDEQVLLYANAFRRTPTMETIQTDDKWFNVGNFYDPKIYHRGYPISQRVYENEHDYEFIFGPPKPTPIGVYASLWLGDPDIDAIERIVNDPYVAEPRVGVNDITTSYAVLEPGTWCPFNSQATAFRSELAPAMFMWPHVGRYDDIWASYVMRRIMDEVGLHAAYGYPWVRQYRNPHDLMVDLGKEVFGMQHTPHVVDIIRSVNLKHYNGDIGGMASHIYDTIIERCRYLSIETAESFRTWLLDLHDISREYDIDFIVKEEV